MRIYTGYQLHTQDGVLTVCGSIKIRKNHSYIVKDVHGQSFSFNRETLLHLIEKGDVRVTN